MATVSLSVHRARKNGKVLAVACARRLGFDASRDLIDSFIEVFQRSERQNEANVIENARLRELGIDRELNYQDGFVTYRGPRGTMIAEGIVGTDHVAQDLDTVIEVVSPLR